MDLSVKVVFVIVVGVLQLAISNVAAIDYIVGDEKGWTTDVDYRAWAKDKFFQVGDRLVFKYGEGDNVVKVKRDEYKNCMASPKSHALTCGYDEIELKTAGRKMFISSVGDHCSDGNQKLAITVYPAIDKDFWKLFFPPTAAPAPAPFSFDWTKLLFPPVSAPPAPSPDVVRFPWKKYFFPPTTAPAPAPSSDDYSWIWKLLFPPMPAPAPAPTAEFPWTWMFPPMANAPMPYFMPRMGNAPMPYFMPPMGNAPLPYFMPPHDISQNE